MVNEQPGTGQWEDGPNHSVSLPTSGATGAGVRVEWMGGVEVTPEAANNKKAKKSDLFKMLLS